MWLLDVRSIDSDKIVKRKTCKICLHRNGWFEEIQFSTKFCARHGQNAHFSNNNIFNASISCTLIPILYNPLYFTLSFYDFCHFKWIFVVQPPTIFNIVQFEVLYSTNNMLVSNYDSASSKASFNITRDEIFSKMILSVPSLLTKILELNEYVLWHWYIWPTPYISYWLLLWWRENQKRKSLFFGFFFHSLGCSRDGEKNQFKNRNTHQTALMNNG